MLGFYLEEKSIGLDNKFNIDGEMKIGVKGDTQILASAALFFFLKEQLYGL